MPTPVAGDGLVYITNAHGLMAPVYAIKDTATGDISLKDGADKNEAVVWAYARGGGYMATPLVYRGILYVVTYNGVLTGYDAKSGEKNYTQRVADGTRVHGLTRRRRRQGLFRQRGRPGVRDQGRSGLELVATNEMGESTLATPAFSEGLMFWRTQGHIIAIGRWPLIPIKLLA